MNARRLLVAAALAGLAATGSAPAAWAEADTVFVFDASNSMWGQIDGVAKIEIARSAMDKLLDASPAAMRSGLVAYGHRREGDCADIEVLVAPGAGDAAGLRGRVAALTPRGKTPIGAALEEAGRQFTGTGAGNTVVLLSDGIETCNADPCAVAAALAERNVDTRVHVIGFDVDAAAREQLQCIAEKGRGIYRDAKDANQLSEAFVQVAADLESATAAAPEPEPEPAAPEWKEVFRDEFDGTDLADVWSVENPDPDAFIVENGRLLLIGKHPGGLESADLPNRVMLDAAQLPAGDWQIEIAYDAEFGTARELAGVGIYTDETDFIAAEAFYSANVTCQIDIRAVKASGGSTSVLEDKAAYWHWCNDKYKELAALAQQPHRVRLTRTGRNYKAAMRFGDAVNEDGSEAWIETGGVSSLRPPQRVAIFAAQRPRFVNEKIAGETLFAIQSIMIRVPGSADE